MVQFRNKKLIKKRNKIFKQARRANSFLLFTEYKLLRSTIRNKIDTLKNSYFEKKINKAENVKSLWKTVKDMGIVTNCLPSPFKYFKINEINRHFAEVSSSHSPTTNKCLNDILCIKLNSNLPIFTFPVIDLSSIESALKRVETSASGSNHLTAHSLKMSLPVIANDLLDIFNKSLMAIFRKFGKDRSFFL